MCWGVESRAAGPLSGKFEEGMALCEHCLRLSEMTLTDGSVGCWRQAAGMLLPPSKSGSGLSTTYSTRIDVAAIRDVAEDGLPSDVA